MKEVAWAGEIEPVFLLHPGEAVSARGINHVVDNELCAVGYLQSLGLFPVSVENGIADGTVEREFPANLGFLRHGQSQRLDCFRWAFEVAWELEANLYLLNPWRWNHTNLVPVAAGIPGLDSVAEVTGGGGDCIITTAIGDLDLHFAFASLAGSQVEICHVRDDSGNSDYDLCPVPLLDH